MSGTSDQLSRSCRALAQNGGRVCKRLRAGVNAGPRDAVDAVDPGVDLALFVLHGKTRGRTIFLTDMIEAGADATSVDQPVPSSPSEPMGVSSDSDALTALIRDVELFHTPAREPFASVLVRGHRENYPVDGRAFTDWLSAAYYSAHKKGLSDNKRKGFLAIISARAKYDGACHEVRVRVAESDGDIYIDLGDVDWRVVRISKTGFEVLPSSPVRFTRPKGMLALPVPERGGSVNELKPFLNVRDDDQFKLIV